METTIRLSHAESALTAGLCCTGGRTMSLSIPSFCPWTIVGSSRFCQDTWFKRKEEIRKLSLRRTDGLQAHVCALCKVSIFFQFCNEKKKDKKLTTQMDSQGIRDRQLHLFLGREVLAAFSVLRPSGRSKNLIPPTKTCCRASSQILTIPTIFNEIFFFRCWRSEGFFFGSMQV